MRISDWSSDVCSSDLLRLAATTAIDDGHIALDEVVDITAILTVETAEATLEQIADRNGLTEYLLTVAKNLKAVATRWLELSPEDRAEWDDLRSEEHTSELKSLMRNSYAVFCLKKKKEEETTTTIRQQD